MFTIERLRAVLLDLSSFRDPLQRLLVVLEAKLDLLLARLERDGPRLQLNRFIFAALGPSWRPWRAL